jgi:hypothetical protein
MHKITHSNFSSEADVISVSCVFLHTLRVDIEAGFPKIGYSPFRSFLLFATRTSVLCFFYLAAVEEDYLFRSLFKFIYIYIYTASHIADPFWCPVPNFKS